jgi:hypothetical protein
VKPLAFHSPRYQYLTRRPKSAPSEANLLQNLLQNRN